MNNLNFPKMIIYDKDTESARATMTLNSRGSQNMFVCPENGQPNFDVVNHDWEFIRLLLLQSTYNQFFIT